MRRAVAFLILVTTLCGCGAVEMMLAPAIAQWETEVYGMRVVYRTVADGQWAGVATWLFGTCTIVLNANLSTEQLVHVAAHELAHCLDGAYLNWSHNGFADEGCNFEWSNGYHCTPREGFAEAYAETYLKKCGYARGPLGLRPDDGIECELPDPRDVKPEDFR